MMATILITGGTGNIGTALTEALLGLGHHVIILTRTKRNSTDKNISFSQWDLEKQTIDQDVITKCDHIIHLAGANVGEKRWTKKRKEEIVNSRVQSGDLLVKAIRSVPNKILSVISASGISFYGDDKRYTDGEPFDETDEGENDFLGETVVKWEKSIAPVASMGKRLVTFRIGIVLSKDAGALKEFKKYLKFGIAPILGNGKQVMSWIHIEDLVRMMIFALENENIRGIYNAVAPKPTTNKEFMLALARSVKGKFFVPMHAPSFAVRMVAGEVATEVLKSTTVSSKKIEKEGFQFKYPVVKVALRNLK